MAEVNGVLVAADSLSPPELVEYALRVERLGYDAIWLPDVFGREVFLTAGFILAHTTRLRVATGIAHVYGRDAISTAQASRTLSEFYDGRFILGLGVSHPQAAEHRGQQWLPPVKKLSTYLEDIANASLVTPAPKKPAPIYIAAHGPRLLALAARSADGANTYLMPPDHTREARQILGPDKELNVVLPCCLCEDPERARKTARFGLSMYLSLPAYHRQWALFSITEADFANGGSDKLVDTLVAWGDETAIRRRIAEHRDAGASQVQVLPYAIRKNEKSPWDLLEALAPG